MKTLCCTIATFLVAGIAAAACLNGHPSIKDEFANSQAVFVGKVIEEKIVPESGTYHGGQNYTLQISEIFKGNLKDKIIIFNENSSGRFPMTVGRIYIIFVYYDAHRYQIDNCGNSGLLDESNEVVKTLRHLNQNK